MEVFGLTGGIGSGKTAVAELLQKYGVPVVAADELARLVVCPGSDGLAEVVETFGRQVLDPRGELDRAAMGRLVFADPEKRRQLESILHPCIQRRYQQVLAALEGAGQAIAVYEVPLLFEKNLDRDMKGTALVHAPANLRIQRVCKRDKMSPDEVSERMRTQMDEDEKFRRADYILYNDGSRDDLRREVEFFATRFLKLPRRRIEIEAELGAAPREDS